jgi:hypothetical protein
MESIAVFDVLNAINGTSAYMVDLDAPDGICATAAVAAAAYRILNHAFPAQGPRSTRSWPGPWPR